MDVHGCDCRRCDFCFESAGLTITIPGSSPDGEEDSTEVRLPEGISKRNDYVYELYSPPEGKIEMDIIFFHGLQLRDFKNAFWKTWLARNDESVIWPRDWLSLTYPNARIFSVSYDSSAQQSEGQLDMYALGENLVSDIIMSENLDIGLVRPVFFVGHSLGGLVIKQLIISAFREQTKMKPRDSSRVDAFLRNFKGVYYYATPHQGSRIADVASGLPFTSPILGLLKTLDNQRARINAEFSQYRSNLGAASGAMSESRPVCYRGPYTCFAFRTVVVEEASARSDIDESKFYTNQSANHFTVCKAETIDSSVIQKLTGFIDNTLREHS